MAKIGVITDSNSGISQEEASALGIYVLPMPCIINGKQYFEGIDLPREEFFRMLEEDADVSTSQPSPGEVMDLWDKLLEEYDELVHIPMSSGLSQSCATANGLSRDYNGKVQVVDNRRISVTMRQSVIDALELIKLGKNAAEIKEILEREGKESSIYITVDTLKYLKKGGRVTAAAAAIGTVLNIKPVLQIQGGKLDSKAKARGMKNAKKLMLKAIQEDIDTRFAEEYKKGTLLIGVSYSKVSQEELDAWLEEVKGAFPGMEIHHDPLSLSVCCHIGEGALAVTVQRLPEV